MSGIFRIRFAWGESEDRLVLSKNYLPGRVDPFPASLFGHCNVSSHFRFLTFPISNSKSYISNIISFCLHPAGKTFQSLINILDPALIKIPTLYTQASNPGLPAVAGLLIFEPSGVGPPSVNWTIRHWGYEVFGTKSEPLIKSASSELVRKSDDF